MRNLILAPPILGIFVAIAEFYLALKDSDYRRWGDRFANTFVVREASLHTTDV